MLQSGVEPTNQQCPHCGGALLTNQSGELWCSCDVDVLIKACTHLVAKAYPSEGGYRVPKREFERVRSKVRRIHNGQH